jgi:hypothetical protein
MARQGPHDHPIAELSHDHSDLGVLVQAVRDTFLRVERQLLPWDDARQELCRSVASVRTGPGSEQARVSWSVFEEKYASHAQDEHRLLRDVGPALDDRAREALRALLRTV